MSETKSAPLNIFQRMPLILDEIGAIQKSGYNKKQDFKFRGIDQCYAAIYPLLAKYKVFMTATVLNTSREERQSNSGGILAFTCLHMRYRFYADDGSFVETEAYGEGMDSGDKSSNKAMSIAHKYAILQAFCIPTADIDDPDKDSHEVAPRGKKPDLVAESIAWIQSQTVAAEIHAAHTENMDWFLAQSKADQDRIQAAMDATLRKIAPASDQKAANGENGADHAADPKEAWANKQIAGMAKVTSLQKFEAFLKGNADTIAQLELSQRAPFDNAVQKTRTRLTGIQAPSDDRKDLINLDDDINF